jgi:hypothetical protein
VNPARRVTVGLCIREGVDGALVVCQGCWRRRWLFWWQIGVGGADDVDVLPWRVRLRCQRGNVVTHQADAAARAAGRGKRWID